MISGIVSKIGGGYVYFFIACAVVTVVGIGYAHYKGLMGDLETAKTNQAKLELALASEQQARLALEGAIEKWEAYAKKQEIVLRNHRKFEERTREEVQKLRLVLEGNRLERLSNAKAKLIERRINHGTADIIRVLNCITSERRFKAGECEYTTFGSKSTGTKSD